ncbi:carbohydrate-binding protein [Listeria kieliensis]|uniref:carbohydrate-binding protein n=1 Tax=Listeria kieliensis TaxID=1621700 RepID=UPI00197B8941|nr:carbohydrate-binding protein [Listeria kieliensis]
MIKKKRLINAYTAFGAFLVVAILLGLTDKAFAREVRVATTKELQQAMKTALPGDEILLAPGTYEGKMGNTNSGHSSSYFNSDQSGTSDAPIQMRSESKEHPAILKGQRLTSGNTLRITGDYWIISDLEVTNGQKGIMLDHSHYSKLNHVSVYEIGMEGVHFRDGSSHNLLENSTISGTGLANPNYGEGVYVGSAKGSWKTYAPNTDYNTIRKTVIGPDVAAEHIDVKEGTTGTIIEDNIFYGAGISGANYADSFLDLKGNEALVRRNKGYRQGNDKIVAAVQSSNQIDNWGKNNKVSDNEFYLDNADSFVMTAGKNSNAIVAGNKRFPEGNMYKGDIQMGIETPAQNLPPVAPTNGKVTKVTSDAIQISWSYPDKASGVRFAVYRNGVLVAMVAELGYLDEKLEASTTYNYEVKAVGETGLISAGTRIAAKTLEVVPEQPGNLPEQPKAWDETQIYTAGDLVFYKGKSYRAKWWTKGNLPGTEKWGPWQEI